MTNQAAAPIVAKASMLIRRPASDAYRAFVDPEMLTRFWLSWVSAPLTPNAKVEWEFMVPGAKDTVEVQTLQSNERIVVRFSDATVVTWTFRAPDASTTIVSVEHVGMTDPASAIESSQGFTIVLCDLKVLLETGASPHLVRDKARLIEMSSAKTS